MLIKDAPFSTAGLDDYARVVGEEIVADVRAAARPLQGARVLHVNATAVGGGVAEMLLSVVPLMRDAGLEADWFVLQAEDRFFEVTKSYHNALQGKPTRWSPTDFDVYWDAVGQNAKRLAQHLDDYDFVIVHDPQPLVLPSHLATGTGWIWRCHIDMTSPSEETWNVLAPHLAAYDLLVFSSQDYVPADLEAERVEIALPCIDPFRPKNRSLRPGELEETWARYGIDGSRPYLLQVSRFDPWKDPLGVLEAYRLVKEQRPEVQLVYMAAMADDDPEGWGLYEQTKEAAGDDPDVHLLALDVPASHVSHNALEVNAMQRGAAVVLQKSIREGFGLVVAEALWKEKAVVAGNAGGIRFQIEDGRNGYLVGSVEECAARAVQLLDDPALASELGRRGHRTVAEQFLFTRLLRQYLGWFAELAPASL